VSLNVIVPRFLPMPSSLDTPEGLLQWAARVGLMFGIPAMLAFALVLRPVRFTLCLTALFIAGACDTGPHGETLLRTRNFFGTLRVTRSTDGKLVKLVHGTTQHGQERLDETGAPRPLMYYHRKGPVGHFFARFPAPKRVAAVGLGVGAMADYVTPGSHWTFYEIDPAVVHIARDSGLFHYLQTAKGQVDITLGDARRKLAAEPDGTFDVIVLDAFSSDAIPVHLLTREALALYARKLTPTGVILCHLSNRYLDLVPLVARLSDDHTPPFRLKANQDSPSDGDRDDGKFPSTWAILFRQPEHLGDTAKDFRFQTTPVTPGPIWRDDFSNLWAVWKWEE
jgi:SAM-dependent methyltransferase